MEPNEVRTRLTRLALQGILAVGLLAVAALIRWLPFTAMNAARVGLGHAFTRDFTATMAWTRASGWAGKRGGWGPALAGLYLHARDRVATWAAPLRPLPDNRGEPVPLPYLQGPGLLREPTREMPAIQLPPSLQPVQLQPQSLQAPPELPEQPRPQLPVTTPAATDPTPVRANGPGVISVRWPGDPGRNQGTPGPAVRPVEGKAIAPFGWHGDVLHYGVDLAAKAGTPVRALWKGKVAELGTDPVIGPYVELDHGQGLTSRYAPVDEAEVKKGHEVQAGQALGRVGPVPAGEPGQNHLHLEVRQDGRAVQPEPFLSDGGGI